MNKYEIKITCCCGARIEIKSDKGYWAGLRYREFLEAHKDCNKDNPQEDYNCNLCKDTGFYFEWKDKGSHFGGGWNGDYIKKYCKCEAGRKLQK
ncbi:MAG: hypothetical protein ACOCQD_03230 [archaeon]